MLRTRLGGAAALMMAAGLVLTGCGAPSDDGAARPASASPTAGEQPHSGSPAGWGPSDLRAAYGLPDDPPEHGTVALITVGPYPKLSEDLATYRRTFGLPACSTENGCLKIMGSRGGPAPAPPATDAERQATQALAIETAADVQMVSAICPACEMIDVQLPLGSAPPVPTKGSDYVSYARAFADAVQTAIAHGADAVNISFTMPGDASMLGGQIAAALDHPGVAIVAASGDYGFNGDGNSLLAQPAMSQITGDSIMWPQALPTVTSVGGTALAKEGARYLHTVWPQTGSGCTPGASPAVGQPAWITGLCGGHRTSADVAAVAENIAIYVPYRPADPAPKADWLLMSGTSLAAPQIAAMYAMGDVQDVHGPNTLYRAEADTFQDVTSGFNAQLTDSDGGCIAAWQLTRPGPLTSAPSRLCRAEPGWDGPTGLGVPHGLGAFR